MVFSTHQYELDIGICVSPNPNPESPSHMPSHPIPPGCHRTLALDALLQTYIRLLLVIYFTYGNMYSSMIFSQIIPPSPSPTESFMSLSPLLPCT